MIASPTNSRRARGFILLPVVLALSLIASVAFISTRDSGTNVAMVVDRADREKARYAAEAGLQHANYVVQQTGCAGSYPLAGATAVSNASFGDASYTAWADRASGSPVRLTATGSYNGASVTLSRDSVIAYQSTIQNFSFQPDTFTGKDTHVSAANPTTNYGSDSSLRLATGAYQPLLQFGFSILPAGSRPVTRYDAATATLVPGAQLSLFQTQAASGGWRANLQLVTRSWSAGKAPPGALPGATWNTHDGSNAWPAPGNGYHPVPLASLANAGTTGWQNWEATDPVAAWLSGAVPNHGVWLVDSGATVSDVRYTSSDESIAITQRPKLTLNYLLPCGASAPKRTTLGPTRDTEIDKDRPNHDLGTRTQMAITREDESDDDPARVLALFDTSSIAPGSTVNSATLRFFVSAVSPLATTVQLNLQAHAMINDAWTEQASWNERTKDSGMGTKAWYPSKGGTFRSTEAARATVSQGFVAGNWIEFDIGPLVQEWVDGITPNLGLVVLTTTFSNDRLFVNSREALSNPPQLVVTYR